MTPPTLPPDGSEPLSAAPVPRPSSADGAAEAARRAARDRKIMAGFGAAAAVMLSAAALSYQGTRALSGSVHQVIHAHEVLWNLAGVASGAKNSQSSVRTYVITGDERSLQVYRDVLGAMPERLAEVRRLVSDDRDQVRRLESVQRLIARSEWFAARTVSARRSRGFKAAAALVSAGDVTRTLADLDAAISEMSDVQRAILADRSARVDSDAHALILTASLARIVGALVLLFAFLTIRRYIVARERTEAELVEAHHAVLRDAEVRRQAQEESRRLGERLRVVLDQVDSGVLLIESNGSLSLCNLAAERLLGAWRGDIERVLRAGSHPPLSPDGKSPLPPEEDPLARALKGEAVRDVRLVLRTPARPGGFAAVVSATPMRSPQGLVTGAILVFRELPPA